MKFDCSSFELLSAELLNFNKLSFIWILIERTKNSLDAEFNFHDFQNGCYCWDGMVEGKI